MLPKKYRLTKKEDFQRVYKEGRFFSINGLIVNFSNNNEGVSRFGFVVGKNYSKSAVERNRAKRVLRASVLRILDKVSPGNDFILGFKKSQKPSSMQSKEIFEIVAEAFKRNKLLK